MIDHMLDILAALALLVGGVIGILATLAAVAAEMGSLCATVHHVHRSGELTVGDILEHAAAILLIMLLCLGSLALFLHGLKQWPV